MSTQTNHLATAADLLSRAAVLWPDAPGLPECYSIEPVTIFKQPLGMFHYHAPFKDMLPTFAAEAVVMRVVADLGKWWMQQDSLDRLWSIRPDRQADWLVHVAIFDHPTLVFANFGTDIDAHLAALRAIVEQGEASRG